MPLAVEVTLPPSEDLPSLGEDELRALAARKLRRPPNELGTVRTRRVSFDARRKFRRWNVSLDVFERGESVPPGPATTPPTFARPKESAPHVVIVGSGPAGLYAALDLLAAGLRVTVLERGLDVQARRRSLRTLNRGEGADPESNYCFGEGGAGTYSDGKLYTRSGNKRAIRGVLETLVAHGAPPDILVSWRPHVGSNRLPEVVRAMRETIERSGGTVRFGARVEELETNGLDGGARRITGVTVRDVARPADDAGGAGDADDADDAASRRARGALETIPADAVILATGHSALDALLMARRAGAELVAKGFAMGVRIEHPQPFVDERQYGGLRGPCDLPASFYELTTSVEDRGVYSFCMCPGGFIVPTTTDASRVVVNGMSLSRRDSPYANSGLVVAIEPDDWCGEAGKEWGFDELLARARAAHADLGPSAPAALPRSPDDDPLFGARLQLALERIAADVAGGANRAPSQRADLVAEDAGRWEEALPTSYRPGLTAVDLREVLPVGIFDRLRSGLVDFDRKLPGFASEIGQLIGVESRTSSPVRIARDGESLEATGVAGLYPCGEGAGYAGGIVSAALDGRRVAAALALRLAP